MATKQPVQTVKRGQGEASSGQSSADGAAKSPNAAAPSAVSGMRQTRPDYFTPYAYGGFGIVPRRGWDAQTAALITAAASNPISGMAVWLMTAPHRLLSTLLEAHPMAAMARSNDIGLAFSPDDTQIVAVKRGLKSDGTFSEQIDIDGTAAITMLFESLPREVGGLTGLQGAIFDQISSAGMTVVEGVPGGSGAGLVDICTADPLTFRFRDAGDQRILEQSQPTSPDGWRAMDVSRVMAVPLFGTRDNPYGKPLRGAALVEMIRDLSNQRRLDDILHSIAWPRMAVGFPLDETVKFASENEIVLIGQAQDGSDLTPIEYAFQQFSQFVAKMATLKHDDTLVLYKDSAVQVLNAAEGLKSLGDTLMMERHRLVMALDQLPSLMGIDTGGTLAYSSTQWRVYAKKLEWIRGFVNGVILQLVNLHLRLLGMPLFARADVEKIRTSDALADQQARQIQINNEYRLVDEGAQTLEDAAFACTGHGPVAGAVRKSAAVEEDEGVGSAVRPARDDERDLDEG